ncbi:MAG: hypothetical protein MZW92_08285 [Comamonadaceae bacterium]|nr:hypothetical protein [Comamonadaceae bacterium]
MLLATHVAADQHAVVAARPEFGRRCGKNGGLRCVSCSVSSVVLVWVKRAGSSRRHGKKWMTDPGRSALKRRSGWKIGEKCGDYLADDHAHSREKQFALGMRNNGSDGETVGTDDILEVLAAVLAEQRGTGQANDAHGAVGTLGNAGQLVAACR